MADVLIFGAGGHASVVASMLPGHNILYVTHEPVSNGACLPIISESEVFDQISKYRQHQFYLGIGDNAARRRVFERLIANGVTPSICIAPTAFIAPSATIGAGSVVCPGSAIMANARLGVNVIVNTLSSVDHDCVVGDHSQITPGVNFGGGAKIGCNNFIGIKAALLPGVSVGDNVTIMAGSIVTSDIPDNVMVGGYPARIVRSQ